MRLSWILAAVAGVSVACPALAQQQQYETPLYTTDPPAALDKNYGLPTFGMPGSDTPQQKTMAPEKTTASEPDFFKDTPDSPEKTTPSESDFFKDTPAIALPKTRTSASGSSEMDTPEFTTTQGSTTGEGSTTGASSTSGDSSTTSYDSATGASPMSGNTTASGGEGNP